MMDGDGNRRDKQPDIFFQLGKGCPGYARKVSSQLVLYLYDRTYLGSPNEPSPISIHASSLPP